MSMLPELPLTKLSGSELIRTATTFCSHLGTIKNDPYLTRNTTAIQSAVQQLRVLDSVVIASEKTTLIEEIDNEIDDLIPVILNDLKTISSKKKFIPVKAEAAETLLAIFYKRDRRKLIYGSYADQGHELETLFQEMDTPLLQQACQVAEILPMYALLKEKHAHLKALLEARHNEASQETTTRAQRQIIRYRLDAMIGYVDTNIADAVDGFATVKTPLSELFIEVGAGVKSRATRKESVTAL